MQPNTILQGERMIDWSKITPRESTVIGQIVRRAMEHPEIAKHTCPHDLQMDISAAHLDIPLKLEELLEIDDGNFFHDVAGIMRHLNRMTGKLEDCFVPRLSAPEGEGV